ncbi:MAG: DUF4937 domain-containing protein [Planctomycetota bacterium]|nr:DUF4937 domain-containing protein [Planctomycetota bacterium]
MLLKWILCDCLSSQKNGFSEAQQQWAKLALAPGFLGQFGGWDKEQAGVLGFWQDLSSYQHFMEKIHDEITDGNRQEQSYQSISVTLLEPVQPIGGSFQLTKLEGQALLRVARCELIEGRLDSFKERQETLWNPGMAQCEGFLGGRWGITKAEKLAFVFTLWKNEAAHGDYQREVFPALKARACTEMDIASIQGYKVLCEPSWLVERL